MRAGPVTADGRAIGSTAWAVITRPVSFFETMPRTGGFHAPLYFLFAISLFDAALVSLSLLVAGGLSALSAAGHIIVLMPLAFLVSGFMLSALLFVLWRLMGSTASYQTAYRVLAYSSGITPVTTVFGFVPYLPTISLIWWFSLFVIASIHVHGINRLKSTAVFAALAVAAIAFVVRLEHRILQPLPASPAVQQSAARVHPQTPVVRI